MQSMKLRDSDKDGAASQGARADQGDGKGKAMTAMAKREPESAQAFTLPAIGMCRWHTLCHFVPISRESWRKLVNAGRAPKPVKLSERCTMYPNAEVHRWLADPAGYQA